MMTSHPIIKKIASFASVGAIVTLISMTTNFIALKYYETPLIATYVTVYVTSILLSFLLNSYFTFKTKFSISNLVKYYLVYMVAMGIGVLLLHTFKSLFAFENWVYPFMVIPFTVAINFYMANKFLRK